MKIKKKQDKVLRKSVNGYVGKVIEKMPKKGDTILVSKENEDLWEEMIIKRRGSKAGTKGEVTPPMYFNLRPVSVSNVIKEDCGRHLDVLGWKFVNEGDQNNEEERNEPDPCNESTNDNTTDGVQRLGGYEVQEVNIVNVPKEDWSREVCEAMERKKESWDWYQVDEEE